MEGLKGINIPGLANYLDKQKSGSGYGGNYWKPKDGDNVLRILPPSQTRNPEIEYFFHEASTHSIEQQTHFCPEALIQQKCPICEARRKLYGGAKRAGRELAPHEKSLAESFNTKRRYLANIIVRGEEDKGVQLWDFGIKMLEKLVKLMSDPDTGDITDLNEGRDFVVVKKSKKGPDGKEWPDYDSSYVKVNRSAVGTPEQITTWMSTQYDLKAQVVPRILSYEKLFEIAFSVSPEQARQISPEKTDSALVNIAAAVGNNTAKVNPFDPNTQAAMGITTNPTTSQTVVTQPSAPAVETGQAAQFTPNVNPASQSSAVPKQTTSFGTMTTEQLIEEIKRRQQQG